MTANRELEQGAAETESLLAALNDQTRRDLLALREKLDARARYYAELGEAMMADRRRAEEELEATLGACVLLTDVCMFCPSFPRASFVVCPSSIRPALPFLAVLSFALSFF